MDTNETADFKRQVRTHLNVVLALVGLIALNVAVTFAPLAGPLRMGIQIALAVLSGALVITFFMHLRSEKTTTHLILAISLVLFAVLLVLTLVAHADHPALTEYQHVTPPPAAAGAHHVP
jgi:caa(3)-type oxidase subunit IV